MHSCRSTYGTGGRSSPGGSVCPVGRCSTASRGLPADQPAEVAIVTTEVQGKKRSSTLPPEPWTETRIPVSSVSSRVPAEEPTDRVPSLSTWCPTSTGSPIHRSAMRCCLLCPTTASLLVSQPGHSKVPGHLAKKRPPEEPPLRKLNDTLTVNARTASTVRRHYPHRRTGPSTHVSPGPCFRPSSHEGSGLRRSRSISSPGVAGPLTSLLC